MACVPKCVDDGGVEFLCQNGKDIRAGSGDAMNKVHYYHLNAGSRTELGPVLIGQFVSWIGEREQMKK